MIIEIILVLFIIFVLIRAALRFRKKEISARELIIWIVFWILVGVAAVLPQTTNFLADKVGVGRGLDLVLVIGVVVLFYLIFRVLVKIRYLDKTITEVTRKTAINNAEQEGKKNEDTLH